MTTPTRRFDVIRTVITLTIVGTAVFAFTPALGPGRIFFRGLLVVGALALVASYLWPWLRRVIARALGRSRN